jgi:hypothetical protein
MNKMKLLRINHLNCDLSILILQFVSCSIHRNINTACETHYIVVVEKRILVLIYNCNDKISAVCQKQFTKWNFGPFRVMQINQTILKLAGVKKMYILLHAYPLLYSQNSEQEFCSNNSFLANCDTKSCMTSCYLNFIII